MLDSCISVLIFHMDILKVRREQSPDSHEQQEITRKACKHEYTPCNKPGVYFAPISTSATPTSTHTRWGTLSLVLPPMWYMLSFASGFYIGQIGKLP